MRKVFLCMYPIDEFIKPFIVEDEGYYASIGTKHPMPLFNQAIEKRYREKGYEVVYATFRYKPLYKGIEQKPGDSIIYADVFFNEFVAFNPTPDFTPKYPDNQKLLEQIGPMDELVVGGFHVTDCVEKMALTASQNNIKVSIDPEMSDLFFTNYDEDYFQIDNYNPEAFKERMINRYGPDFKQIGEEMLRKNFSSPFYGFSVEPGVQL